MMMMMMMKQEPRSKDSTWARLCDTCRVVPCTVYCRADSAYLCTGCDAQVHGANQVASRHERVWVCEACEQAPAAFLCKADAASLCAACDADVHSANPLARRHHRVPILPIAGSLYGPLTTDPRGARMMTRPNMGGSGGGHHEDDNGSGFLAPDEGDEDDADEDDEAASWLILNPGKGVNLNHNNNNGYLMGGGGGVDEYLDLVDPDNQFADEETDGQKQEYNGLTEKSYGGGDSVVPVQSVEAKDDLQYQQQLGFQLGIDYETKPGYGYSTSSSHSVSVPSLQDVGVVPDSTLMSNDISNKSHAKPSSKGTIDLFSGPPTQTPMQLSPMDREARVLRYREKKKTRKFEKTIRYASRKAYAETRPRIKGRFAKRSG